MNAKSLINRAAQTLSKNSPAILTALGVAGVMSTSILAVKATPKALQLIDEEKDRRDKLDKPINLTPIDAAKLCWKLYLPAIATGAATIACIICAHKISMRRNAAIASLYSLTDAAFKEYKEQVVETIGSNKEKKIEDKVAEEKILKSPVSYDDVIATGYGDTMCFDALIGRYFKCDAERIRHVVNKLNQQLLRDNFIALNELYYELGLKGGKLGYLLGWDIDKGLIDVRFSSCLMEDKVPCLVMDFDVHPKFI